MDCLKVSLKLLPLTLFSFLFCSCLGIKARNIDFPDYPVEKIPLAYHFTINIDNKEKTVDVLQKTIISPVLLKNQSVSAFFCLSPLITEDFVLEACFLESPMQNGELEYQWKDGWLNIDCGSLKTSDQEIVLVFRYSIKLPKLMGWPRMPEHNIGYRGDFYQLQNWFFCLAPLNKNGEYLRWQYHSPGDPFNYQLASFKGEIFCNDDSLFAASGIKQKKTGQWEFENPVARSCYLLWSPRYQCYSLKKGKLHFKLYCQDKYQDKAALFLKRAMRVYLFYTDFYGPLYQKEIILVQNAYEGNMESSGLISIRKLAFDKNSERSFFGLFSLILMHEMAHQWWYDFCGSNQTDSPWIDESLAEYSLALYLRSLSFFHYRYWWKKYLDKHREPGSLNRSIYQFDNFTSYYSEIYKGGCFFWRDIEKSLGKRDFKILLRQILKLGSREVLETETVLDLLRQYGLNDIINKYFYF